jgi:hypothetical protein
VSGHPIKKVFLDTLDVLERCDVECAVMGGFAVHYWALPRPTYDVDFAVALDGDALASLLRALEEAGFVVPVEFAAGWTDTLAGMRKVAVKRTEGRHVWNVDVFLAATPFVRSAFDRRVPATIEGRAVKVVSAEDLLLFKLWANRRKDLADVEDMLLLLGTLDTTYLRQWAARLGILDRVEATLRESGRA